MSDQVSRVREKVRQILTQKFNVGVDSDGDYTVAYESAQGWIRVLPISDDGEKTVVRVEAPLLFGVKETDELYKYVAIHTDDYMFGHLSLAATPDGMMVMFVHTLLGNYLDEEELLAAVIGVVGSGNDLDDKLQGMFGGRRYSEV